MVGPGIYQKLLAAFDCLWKAHFANNLKNCRIQFMRNAIKALATIFISRKSCSLASEDLSLIYNTQNLLKNLVSKISIEFTIFIQYWHSLNNTLRISFFWVTTIYK